MPYRIWNTALDHTRRMLQRRAAKMQMEPIVGGKRLRLRSSMVLDDALFEHNKANLELYRSWGVVDWEEVGAKKAPVEKKVEKPKVEPKLEEPPQAPPEEVKPEAPPPTVIPLEELAKEVPAAPEPPPAETAPSEVAKPQPIQPKPSKGGRNK